MDRCQWGRGWDGFPPSRGHGMGEAGWSWGAIDSSLRYVQNDMGGRCAWNDMWGALRSE